MPPNTRYVGRGTRWGNPFRVGDRIPVELAIGFGFGIVEDHAHAVTLYDAWVRAAAPFTVDEVRAELGGYNLACWCPIDQPCHADVLLRLANPA